MMYQWLLLHALVLWGLGFIPMAMGVDVLDVLTRPYHPNYVFQMPSQFDQEYRGLRLQKASLHSLDKIESKRSEFQLKFRNLKNKFHRSLGFFAESSLIRNWGDDVHSFLLEERNRLRKYTTLFTVTDSHDPDNTLGLLGVYSIPYDALHFRGHVTYGRLPTIKGTFSQSQKIANLDLCLQLKMKLQNSEVVSPSMERFFGLDSKPEFLRSNVEIDALYDYECYLERGFLVEPVLYAIKRRIGPKKEKIKQLLELALYEHFVAFLTRFKLHPHLVVTYNNYENMYIRKGFKPLQDVEKEVEDAKWKGLGGEVIDLINKSISRVIGEVDFYDAVSGAIANPMADDNPFLIALLWKRTMLLGLPLNKSKTFHQINGLEARSDHYDEEDGLIRSLFSVFDNIFVVESYYEDGYPTSIKPREYRMHWNEDRKLFEFYSNYSFAFPVAAIEPEMTLEPIPGGKWLLQRQGQKSVLMFNVNAEKANKFRLENLEKRNEKDRR